MPRVYHIIVLSLMMLFRHCEEGVFRAEAISNIVVEIASGKEQVRPRNDETLIGESCSNLFAGILLFVTL